MKTRWFDRRFAPVAPDLLPDLLERLRGTPARLEERVAAADRARLCARDGERWSAQENIGHLLDLEPLWRGRVDDFAARRDVLRPTDVENRATWAAEHNRAGLDALLLSFRGARGELVRALQALPGDLLARTARHPRLGTPMTPADLAFFVAEHDDHHLARIGELVDAVAAPTVGAPVGEQLFFVLERFRPGRAADVYRRFRDRGRLAPAGLRYVASWVDLAYERCFQVMAARDERLLAQWTANWQDLVDFEITRVRTSGEAAAAMAARL
jgi:uncharacterized damage-inducible protein DinB